MGKPAETKNTKPKQTAKWGGKGRGVTWPPVAGGRQRRLHSALCSPHSRLWPAAHRRALRMGPLLKAQLTCTICAAAGDRRQEGPAYERANSTYSPAPLHIPGPSMPQQPPAGHVLLPSTSRPRLPTPPAPLHLTPRPPSPTHLRQQLLAVHLIDGGLRLWLGAILHQGVALDKPGAAVQVHVNVLHVAKLWGGNNMGSRK